MRFALLVAGSVGALALGFSGVAHANEQSNGIQVNGIQVNGIQVNGIQVNGIQVNGIQVNGIQVNGIQVNGIQVNGSGLTGSLIGSSTSTCSHREDVVGAALAYNCSPCAKFVQDADSTCRYSLWGSRCVLKARSMCAITSQNLVGATFTASMKKGDNTTSSVTLRVDGVRTLATGDRAHQISYYVPGVCRYFLGKLQCTVSRWEPLCDSTASDGGYNEAIVAPGSWELRTGYRSFHSEYTGSEYSGGGKIPGSAEAGLVTFACREVGAVAKCIENNGYRPWTSLTNDKLHQACVRMLRADYCGDGRAWTRNGTQLNVYDNYSIQYDTVSWLPEAGWDEYGATCTTGNYRYNQYDPNTDVSSYIYNHLCALGGGTISNSSCSVTSHIGYDQYTGATRTPLVFNETHYATPVYQIMHPEVLSVSWH